MIKNNSNEHIAALLQRLIEDVDLLTLQLPTLGRCIVSLEEMKSLFSNNLHLVEELLLTENPEEKLWAELEALGTSANASFQLPFADILETIVGLERMLISAIEDQSIEFDIDTFLWRSKKAKQLFAKGYFYSALEEYIDSLCDCNIQKSSVVYLHFDWLGQIKSYLKHETDVFPIYDYTLCPFSQWFKTITAEIVLFASGEERYLLSSNILLAHRKVHDEATYIGSYVNQCDYIRAVSGLESFYKHFLQLEKYIYKALMNYDKGRHDNFLSYAVNKGSVQKGLIDYLVVNLSEGAYLLPYYKANILKEISENIHSVLKEQDLDFYFHFYKDELHVLLRKSKKISFAKLNEIIFSSIKKIFEKDVYKIHKDDLIAYSIKLDLLDCCDSEYFKKFLRQLKNIPTNKWFNELAEGKIKKINSNIRNEDNILFHIKKCIEDSSFVFVFQPIVNKKRETEILEALIRLPINNKLLEACHFMDLVEFNKMTLQLDKAALAILPAYLPKLVGKTQAINVNIYPDSIANASLVQDLIDLNTQARKHGLRLVIELTEHTVVEYVETISLLYREHGIAFAIDDFGTGYSNMKALMELSLKKVVCLAKLDGSMIEGIDVEKNRLELVELIVKMTEVLNLRPVIAEFVDSETKLNALVNLNYDIVFQGYYFSKAKEVNEL